MKMDTIQTILSFLSVCVAAVGAYFAFCIPEKIKWEQLYVSLLTEYMSYDFAVANQSVIEFFYTECGKDFSKIKQKSEEHYLKEFYLENDVPPERCLHFQRRLLTQFYWLLDFCANSKYIGKERVSGDFTVGDANIIKIVFWMNEAVIESDILFKDINVAEKIPCHRTVNGINRSLADLSEILSKSQTYIKARW